MFIFNLATVVYLIILICLCVTTINLSINLFYFRRLDQFPTTKIWPFVSILVPARNEEDNIRRCLESLLAQDYPRYEVIVLNDESTDQTGIILEQMAAHNPHLVVLDGNPLPPGWYGKNWACHQLAEAAQGELILFTDADTIHHPLTLTDGVSSLVAQNADLLTAIPHEKLDSWGERILLPYLFFSCLAFFPIGIAFRLKNPVLCYAIGQFLLFKRSSYLQIGGHQIIKGKIMEDLTLGRMIKKAGLRWRMADGGLRVQCRMYHNFSGTWKGLSRFLFLGYDNKILQLLTVWALTGLAMIGPLLLLILRVAGAIHNLSYGEVCFGIILDLLLWAVAYWRLRFPIYLSFLFPATYLLNFAATLYSGFLITTGRATWKGRPLIKIED
jgi:chlorobactene glucosyltransferase